VREVAIAGGDLFRIAATLLGDPLRWAEIAELNQIDDVLVAGLVVLKVPDATTED
jgi:hypothetical protein